MSSTGTIRLYVVEEQEVYRVAMGAAFTSRGAFELMGVVPMEEIGTADRFLNGCGNQVLIVGGKEITAEVLDEVLKVRKAHPKVGVLMMAMNYKKKDMGLIHRCASTGHGGFALVSKQSLDHVEQLANTIISVNQGQIVLDSRASLLFMDNSDLWKDLTTREMEVLRLLAGGYSNLAIAQALYIDIRTVKNHINSLYQKLGTVIGEDKHPRVSLARFYLREGEQLEEMESCSAP